MRVAGIQSIQRALEILDLFSEDRPGVHLNDIAAHLGVSPITAYRYVRAFCEVGLMDLREGEAFLAPRVMRLAHLYLARDRVLQAAREPLMVAQQQTGETLALCELQGAYVVCTYRIDSRQALRTSFAVGQAMPIFAGAFARVLAAYLPASVLAAVLAQTRWQRYTEHTVADPDQFLARLDIIRQRGYDTSIEEVDRGVFAAAVPILAPIEGVLGSIGLSMPLARFEPDRLADFLKPLWTAKRAIEAQLAAATSDSVVTSDVDAAPGPTRKAEGGHPG
jgi:DNA-binding IclR family transcriptional regulator